MKTFTLSSPKKGMAGWRREKERERGRKEATVFRQILNYPSEKLIIFSLQKENSLDVEKQILTYMLSKESGMQPVLI